MGVNIPLGFGLWRMPFRLAGDVEEMLVTCGIQDDPLSPPNLVADTVTNALLATNSFQAASGSNQYSCGPGRVTLMRSLGPIEGVGSVSRAFTNAAVPPPPQNVALLVQKRTARGGRQGRGRMYFPPFLFAESVITATGTIAQGLIDQFTNDLEAWRVAVAGTAFDLVLLHGDPLVGSSPPPDVITSLTAQPLVATQRTRLRR